MTIPNNATNMLTHSQDTTQYIFSLKKRIYNMAAVTTYSTAKEIVLNSDKLQFLSMVPMSSLISWHALFRHLIKLRFTDSLIIS
jgi:hypothetical protein